MENELIFFFGTDCPHCDAMRPLIAKLVFETGVSITEHDIWKSEHSARLLENYQAMTGDKDCQGIPFFYNTKTKAFLCGEVSYKKLKNWAILD